MEVWIIQCDKTNRIEIVLDSEESAQNYMKLTRSVGRCVDNFTVFKCTADAVLETETPATSL